MEVEFERGNGSVGKQAGGYTRCVRPTVYRSIGFIATSSDQLLVSLISGYVLDLRAVAHVYRVLAQRELRGPGRGLF